MSRMYPVTVRLMNGRGRPVLSVARSGWCLPSLPQPDTPADLLQRYFTAAQHRHHRGPSPQRQPALLGDPGLVHSDQSFYLAMLASKDLRLT